MNNCHKQLVQFQTDNSCRAAKALFTEFDGQTNKSESLYLANFYKVANTTSIQNHTQGQNGQRSGGGAATGAAAANRDQLNPNMNLQAYRLMFSPRSKIMTVHYIVLNPFQLQEVKRRDTANTLPAHALNPFPSSNGGINSQEYLEFLKTYSTEDASTFYTTASDSVVSDLRPDN